MLSAASLVAAVAGVLAVAVPVTCVVVNIAFKSVGL